MILTETLTQTKTIGSDKARSEEYFRSNYRRNETNFECILNSVGIAGWKISGPQIEPLSAKSQDPVKKFLSASPTVGSDNRVMIKTRHPDNDCDREEWGCAVTAEPRLLTHESYFSANTHCVRLNILAGFDHRRQRNGVVQEHLARGRLLHVSHPATTVSLGRLIFNEVSSPLQDEGHPQPDDNKLAANVSCADTRKLPRHRAAPAF